jgi:hypothetical protein
MKPPILLTAFTLVILTLTGNASMSPAQNRAAPEGTAPVARATRFSSRYTSLSSPRCGSGMTKKEEREADKHGSDIPTRCKGYGGYNIFIFYSACTSEFRAEKGDQSIRLASQAVDWKQKTVEWRIANGKPFAVIMRVYEYSGDEHCGHGGKITGEFLIVQGLQGYEHLDERVEVKATPNPNLKAREIADKGYARVP